MYGEESRNFVATRFQSAFFFQYGKNTGLPQKHEMREPPRPAIGRVAGLLESPTAFARRVAKGRAVRSRFPPAASRVAFPSRRPRASRFPRQIPAEGSSLAR